MTRYLIVLLLGVGLLSNPTSSFHLVPPARSTSSLRVLEANDIVDDSAAHVKAALAQKAAAYEATRASKAAASLSSDDYPALSSLPRSPYLIVFL